MVEASSVSYHAKVVNSAGVHSRANGLPPSNSSVVRWTSAPSTYANSNRNTCELVSDHGPIEEAAVYTRIVLG
eukprot:scaffold1790_cov130-Isochrysis_galbana.AAC.7